jgi:tetratricopeptide (TPR) repeat protein
MGNAGLRYAYAPMGMAMPREGIRMRIASVTMAGPGSEAIIGDALRSVVDWVDECGILNTETWDMTHDRLLDVADPIAGDKRRIWLLNWRDDFSFMRNAALDTVERLGCQWAVWLDADERLVVPDPDLLREELGAQPHTVSALRAWSVDGSYAKERFIRLPRQGEYVGPTHEFYSPAKGTTVGVSLAARFDELPKDPDSEAFKHKLERDKRILYDHLRTHREARWLFYLGETESLLGNEAAAIAHWQEAVKTDGHGEMRAWAAFRAANALIEHGNPKNAKQIAMTGLMVYPHGPELFYAIAKACVAMGQWHDAIQWAQHAAVAGSYHGWGREVNRTGFVCPPAAWEAPFDLMARAYAKLGQKELAKEADKQYKAAIKKREGA